MNWIRAHKEARRLLDGFRTSTPHSRLEALHHVHSLPDSLLLIR
jgi:hypothetical protein